MVELLHMQQQEFDQMSPLTYMAFQAIQYEDTLKGKY